ncbi:MAG: prepilin-type N-terminal cleavage/methylation domain-containing protein [Phycisphaerales bacterium]|nr:prepilin-type N-terminal cleavage/methylation domain-containing protein [Phycisphaerales bacterium]
MRTTPSRTRTARRGLSLIEVVSALVITSILMLAMGSTIAIATSAIPAGRSTAETTIRQRDVMERMIADLRLANSLLNLDRGADITFTVPDRNGDGQDETIRYAWTSDPDTCTATAGDPIIYQYNGGTPITIARSAQGLGITTLSRIMPGTGSSGSGGGGGTGSGGGSDPMGDGGSPVTSAEVLLVANDTTDVGSTLNIELDQNDDNGDEAWRVGQSFKPVLPANTTSWAITRIEIKVRQRVGKGRVTVELKPLLLNMPNELLVISSNGKNVKEMPSSLDWESFALAASGRSPSETLAFTVETDRISVLDVGAERNDVAPTGSTLFATGQPLFWTPRPAGQALLFRVYGTYTTTGAPLWAE